MFSLSDSFQLVAINENAIGNVLTPWTPAYLSLLIVLVYPFSYKISVLRYITIYSNQKGAADISTSTRFFGLVRSRLILIGFVSLYCCFGCQLIPHPVAWTLRASVLKNAWSANSLLLDFLALCWITWSKSVREGHIYIVLVLSSMCFLTYRHEQFH